MLSEADTPFTKIRPATDVDRQALQNCADRFRQRHNLCLDMNMGWFALDHCLYNGMDAERAKGSYLAKLWERAKCRALKVKEQTSLTRRMGIYDGHVSTASPW